MNVDVAVAGGGIVGLAAALRASQAGARVVVIDPGATPKAEVVADGRTAALLLPAIDLLRSFGVWGDLENHSGALSALRIVNLPDGCTPTADITFRAHEAGADVFGHNIPNDLLRRVLFGECLQRDRVVLATGRRVAAIEVSGDDVSISLDDGDRVVSRLLIAADGRNSFVRRTVGISTQQRVYRQTAIVCSFSHERPHDETSIELHRPGGPFTMVPLPGQRSSLVWVEPDHVAARLRDLDDSDFLGALAVHAERWVGAVSDVSVRRSFALRAVLARHITNPRVALVGEAAHALSPIGAQGLNLSLRDIDILGELIDDGLRAGGDPGAAAILAQYRARRVPDIMARFHAIDGLNRLVASDLPLLGMVRGIGLRMVGSIAPLRRQLMRSMMNPVMLPSALARIET